MRSGEPPSFIRHQVYQGSSLKPRKLDKEALLTRTIEVKRPNRKKMAVCRNNSSGLCLELRTVIQKVRICYVMQKRSTMRARMARIGSQIE